MRLDLGFDGGEGEDDEALAPYATTIHIACGGHTGDDDSMRRALTLARASGLIVGAHPSYPDREGFGRKTMSLPLEELASHVAGQVGRLVSLAGELGVRVTRLKPHGALYHDAARRDDLADAVIRASLSVERDLTFVSSPGSRLLSLAAARGASGLAEGFADRRYQSDGTLVSRADEDALLTDPDEAAAQAEDLVLRGEVTAKDGTRVKLRIECLCVHGDTPGAPAIARAVRARLEARR